MHIFTAVAMRPYATITASTCSCVVAVVSAKLIDVNEITPGSKYVWVYNDGTCSWFPRFDLSVSHCNVDVKWFPFDTQKCDLVFLSWRVENCMMLNFTVIDQENDTVYFESQAWKLTRA